MSGKQILRFKVLALFAVALVVFAGLASAASLSLNVVNQDPDPAVAGNLVNLRIGVQNIGSDTANDVVISIVPEYPFELVPGTTASQDIGTVIGYQGYYDTANMKIVKYQLRVDSNAPAGTYPVKITYNEAGSASIQTLISVDVKNQENAEVIQIDKTSLVPGVQTPIKFKISNVGNAPLKDLTFYWENADNIILPVGSDNTRYVKYLDVNDSAIIEYQVIADTNAQAGLYKLDLHLSYSDSVNNSQQQVSTIAGLYVGGGTDFDVAFSESSSGQTSFSIANVGSNPATSVSIIIPQQQNWRVTGSNSVIVGNLNKGDYTVASFTLQSLAATAAAGFNRTARTDTAAQPSPQDFAQRITNASQTLDMQIAYTDTMGQRQLIQKQIELSLQNLAGNSTQAAFATRRTNGSDQLVLYAAIAVVAVALVGGYLFYRRRKRAKLKALTAAAQAKTRK